MNGFFLQGLLAENIWVVLTLFFFVWVFTWAKKNLESATLGVIFAIIVVFLTFYSFPELVWITVIVYILMNYGKDLKKLNPWDKMGKLR